MKLFKNAGKRGLSLLIAMMLCVGMLPVSAFAADESGTEPGTGVSDPAEPQPDLTEPEDDGDVSEGNDGDASEGNDGDASEGDVDDVDPDAADSSGSDTWESESSNGVTVTGTQTSSTEVKEEDGNTVTTEKTEWSGEGVGTGTQGKVEVSGSETTTTTTETVIDSEGNEVKRPVSESGSEEGAEKTTVTVSSSITSDEVVEHPEKTEQKLELGTPEVTYEKENIISSETSSTESSMGLNTNNKDEVTVTVNPGEKKTETIETDKDALVQESKPGNGAEHKEFVDPITGAVTTVVTTRTPITDEKGNTIGWKVETVTTTTKKRPLNHSSEVTDPEVVKQETGETTQVGESKTEVEKTQSNTTLVLPERPQESETTNAETGEITKVTVEDVLNATGAVIGYKTITTVTGADGKVISTATKTDHAQSSTEYGTTTTTTTVEETEFLTTTQHHIINKEYATTDVTVKEEVTESTIQTTDRTVTVSMTQVSTGEDHGKTQTGSLKPTVKEPNPGSTDTKTDLYHRPDGDPKEVTSDYVFKWIGEYGLESAIRVDAKPYTDAAGTHNNQGWQAHQFILRDKEGKEHYVYCSDFEVSPVNGTIYNMVNLEESNYFKDDDTAQHIRSIALNGYWGTESGTGSLSEFKKMLVKEKVLSSEEAEKITDGMALAATQAAIWYYGNSGTHELREDPFSWYYRPHATGGKEDWDKAYEKHIGEEGDKILGQIYQHLIKMPQTTEQQGHLIQAGDVKGAAVTVKDKVGGATSSEDKYTTDISFTVDLKQSKLDPKQTQVILSGDGVDETFRLESDGKGGFFFANNEGVVTCKDGVYTLTMKNVKLPNGQQVTVTLKGKQEVSADAYLMSATSGYNKSQTFVTVEKGLRDIDLSFGLTFQVTEATAQLSSKTETKETVKTLDSITTREDTVTSTLHSSQQTTKKDIIKETLTVWGSNWDTEYSYSDIEIGDDDDDDDDDDDVIEGDDDDDDDVIEGDDDDDDDVIEGDDDDDDVIEGDDDDDDVVEGDDDDDDDDDDDIVIPDDPTPLTDTAPVEEAAAAEPADGVVTIEDEAVPLSDAPAEEELVELPEDPVPLAAMPPETGDPSLYLVYLLLLFAGSALFSLRKKEEAEG